MPRYDAIGFDLLAALLDTWSTWMAVAGGADLGMRWPVAAGEAPRSDGAS